MSDVLTTWDPVALAGDWLLDGPDLGSGRDLETAAVLSLFTDRLALADDPLPDPSDGDRRGWWADWNADASGVAAGPIGSRLWLLSREKQLDSVRLRAEDYTREALTWMIEDGVADQIEITAEWNATLSATGAPGRLDVSVIINRDGAQLLSRSFSWAWTQNRGR